MKNTKKIEFECIKCGFNVSISKQSLQKRRYYAGEYICVSCYRKLSPGGKYGKEYYPKELQRVWLDAIWDYDMVKPYINTLKTKKKIRFRCKICKKEDIMSLNAMKKRKIVGNKPICRKCSLLYAVNSKEWRDANSKSQLIAQNRPEVLEKQREAQKKLMENDPLYIEKRMPKSYISGTIEGMKFDSSWEMFYIVYCWENPDIVSIERCSDKIEYYDNDNKKHVYHPDFLVVFKNGVKKIIEIKGSRKYNNFHEKFNAANKKFRSSYVVYGQKELYKMGITFRQKHYCLDFFKKGYNIEFYDNPKTRNFKEQIKQWQK